MCAAIHWTQLVFAFGATLIFGILIGAGVMMFAAFRREEIEDALREPPEPPMGIGA